MNELALYLVENAVIDFQGSITLDDVRNYLRNEDSSEARELLQKLLDDGNLDDLMLTVADCLKEFIRTGINERVVKDQLVVYSDS